MGMNNKSELMAGLQRVLLTSIIKQDLMHLMAPFPTNSYLRVMSTYCQKAYYDYLGGRSDGLLNLLYHQDVIFLVAQY